MAPPTLSATGGSHRVTGREFWLALKWGLGYEAVVWTLSIASAPLLLAYARSLVCTVIVSLLAALLLPATLVTFLAGHSRPSWGAALALLALSIALNIAAATGVALFVIHRRAHRHDA